MRDTEIRGREETETVIQVPASPRLPVPASHSSSFPFSSFVLSLVSSQKFLNVRVLGTSQAFVRPTENDVSIAHHHYLAIS
jgi:hypothetical protein